MASGKFKVSFKNGKVDKVKPSERIAHSESEISGNYRKGSVHRNEQSNEFKFVPDTVDQEFDEFITGDFIGKVFGMGLTKKNIDKIFELSDQLIRMHAKSIEKWMNKKQNRQIDFNMEDVIKESTEYSCKKLHSLHSDYLRKKFLKTNRFYVEPQEMAICSKWTTSVQNNTDLNFDKMKQGTFQFIKPSSTLEALFLDSDFKKLFFKYNQSKHECVDGEYAKYCCGRLFKNRTNELTIDIQIGMDEFEPCSPLKSKATVHKLLGVYFKILNMPSKYSSRVNNIFLIALCESANFKAFGCSIDDVFNPIVDNLLHLEKIGVRVSENTFLKVRLIMICCDNLGANTVFGLNESFSATYYCRFCEVDKSFCQIMTKEVKEKLRTLQSYNSQISKLQSLINITDKGKQTLGIRRPCVFNNLKNFHVTTNVTADIAHDVKEGAIMFFLSNFFNYCVQKKILTEAELIRRVRDYNYGSLNSRNKPSKLKILKPNLGQNASQLYCLMIHLPFMFIDKKGKLTEIWPMMLELLHACRIIFSKKIRESDICVLGEVTHNHLSSYKTGFKVPLKPKHHNMTHYSSIIREMGPLLPTEMLCYERKHAVFTPFCRQTRNFINIAKTLAERHQKTLASKIHSFKDEVNVSKKTYRLTKSHLYPMYKTHLERLGNMTSEYSVLDFAKVNGYMYRNSTMLVENFEIYEIVFVLQFQNSLFLLCKLFKLVKFEAELNSIEIKETELCFENLKLFEISKLQNAQPFQKKNCNGSAYLIVENLSVYDKFD